MKQAKAMFLLPQCDNGGNSLAEEIIKVQLEVFEQFFGWSLVGLVEGAFRMVDGSQTLDRCECYFLILDEDRLGELERILVKFKEVAGQEKLYLEITHQVDVRFL